MRMNNCDPSLKTAAQLLDQWSEKKIARILADYGEEKQAKKIARFIVKSQEKGHPVKTTTELKELVIQAYPAKKIRAMRINPATKTFQALRIAVNRELEVLEKTIPKLIPIWKQAEFSQS